MQALFKIPDTAQAPFQNTNYTESGGLLRPLASSRKRRRRYPGSLRTLAPVTIPERRKRQGNRVKESCGNEAYKELIVPGRDFAL